MSYMATFLRGAIIGLLVAFICRYTQNSKIVKSIADLRYRIESLREMVNYNEMQLSNCFSNCWVRIDDKEPHKPDTFQCPHCGTTLQWTDNELWRGYIECRSGWTAATPTPVTQDDWWVYIVPTNAGWKMNRSINIKGYITTNRVWITRDPIDDMPMYSVDNNGGLAL